MIGRTTTLRRSSEKFSIRSTKLCRRRGCYRDYIKQTSLESRGRRSGVVPHDGRVEDYGPAILSTTSARKYSRVGITGINSGLFAIGVYGVVNAVTVTTTVIFAVEGMGWKMCLLIGGLGQGFMMLWIGGYSVIHPQTTIVPVSYVSIVAVYLYAVFYCIKFGPGILWVVAGEVAPNHVRTAAMSLAIGVNWLFSFTISRVTPSMLEDHVWDVFTVRDVLHADVGVGILLFAGDEGLYAGGHPVLV